MELHRTLKVSRSRLAFFILHILINFFMKFIFSVLFIFISISGFSQNKFEEGCYIDN